VTDYYTSDPHFSHARILELCNRPFGSVEEMNEALIYNYNTTIRSRDRLIFMGDVALGKIADSLPLINRIKGYKVLVPGNHDRIWPSKEMDKYRERFMPEYKKVFDEVWPQICYGHVKNIPVMFSHLPYTGDSHSAEDRYQEFRPSDEEGLPLICGHVHEKWKVSGRQVNCGVDVWDFKPVHEDQLEEELKKL